MYFSSSFLTWLFTAHASTPSVNSSQYLLKIVNIKITHRHSRIIAICRRSRGMSKSFILFIFFFLKKAVPLPLTTSFICANLEWCWWDSWFLLFGEGLLPGNMCLSSPQCGDKVECFATAEKENKYDNYCGENSWTKFKVH